jgi:signal peptidase I
MKEKHNKGEEESKSVVRELLELVGYMAVVLVLAMLIVTFVGQRTMVSGSSMESTLHDKDNLIVDKISYRFSEPKRFDIIVFPPDVEEDTYYIKRIIGMPGEKIQIIDGKILIDDKVLEEDYGNEVIQESGRASDAITLGEDEYFVMGDNRNASLDSRFDEVGNIHRSDIIGRAWVRVWPLNKFGVLKHQ